MNARSNKKTVTGRPRSRRYALDLPNKNNPWTKSCGPALQNVFGYDDLGGKALALFQSSLQPRTYKNYGSNMTSFFRFCEEHATPPSTFQTSTSLATSRGWESRERWLRIASSPTSQP